MHTRASRSECGRRIGDMADRLRAERVVEGLQGPLLQIEVAKIVAAEADEPYAFVDFLDTEALAGEHGGDIDLLAMQADTATGGDQHVAVVEWVAQLRQPLVAAGGGGVELGGALHLERLVRTFAIELAHEVVEPCLLLQAVE